jgi:hypothetical protein
LRTNHFHRGGRIGGLKRFLAFDAFESEHRSRAFPFRQRPPVPGSRGWRRQFAPPSRL